MKSASEIWPGRRLPVAQLGEIVDGEVVATRARDVFGKGLALVVGVPAAFSPVCSERHVPSLVANADRIRRGGVSQIVCVVTSDPFAMQAWARVMDPAGKVRFVSDGNLDFTRGLGLVTRHTGYFLGDRSERYMMTTRDGVVETMRIERQITDYTCTRPDEFVLEGT
jgi:peroxiredoxin